MKAIPRKNFPVEETRRYLEPGPIILVSSAWKGKTNIMTMGWHMVMGFTPALFACYIWNANHSFDMIRKSRQCVVNLPTTDLIDEVIGIGNCSGTEVDKFEHFGLTAQAGTRIGAPLIGECYANFECKLYDGSQTSRHGLFIWEIVEAHVAASPKYPETVHYRGDGVFMISGKNASYRNRFKAQNL
jgi:flavin reductase (DIM6/NTAB) family NADH-FMN oxidoreductase RutF